MYEVLAGLLFKFKAYIIAILMAFASSSVRYIEYKRKVMAGYVPKVSMDRLKDWFLFGCMSTVITLTGLAVIEQLGYEFSFPFAILLFWLGYMTDYLYQFIPNLIKKQLNKTLNNE